MTSEPVATTTPRGRRTLTNVLFSGGQFVWMVALSVLATPLIVRAVGVEEFGLWSLVVSITGLASFVLDPGFATSAVNYLSEPAVRRSAVTVARLVGSSVFASLVAGSIGAVAFALLAQPLAESALRIPPYLQANAILLLRISGLILLVNFVVGSVSSVLKACQRYDILSTFNAATKTLSTFLILALLWMGLGLEGLALGTLAAIVCSFFCLVIIVPRVLPAASVRSWRVDFRSLGLLFGFGKIYFLMSTLDILIWQLPRIMLGVLVSATAVTYFVVPMGLASLIHGFVASALQLFFPLSSELASQGLMSELKKLYKRGARVVSLFVNAVAVPLIFLAPQVMRHWMGPDFELNSGGVLSLLLVSYYLLTHAIIPHYVLNGMGRPQVNLFFITCHLAIDLPVGLLLIPKYGPVGAALTMLIGYMAIVYALYYVEVKVLGFSWKEMLCDVYLPSLIPAWVVGVVLSAWGNLLTQQLWTLGLIYFVAAGTIVIASLGIGELTGDTLGREAVKVLHGLLHRIAVARQSVVADGSDRSKSEEIRR